MNMNIKPAFRYQLGGYLRASAIFYLVMALLISAFVIGTLSVSVNGDITLSFMGGSAALTVFMFVAGIVSIRSDVRLCLQYGVSRRTAFAAGLLAALCGSALLALATGLLVSLAQLLTVNQGNSVFADLYQMLYLGMDLRQLSLGQQLLSALLNVSLMMAACLLGMFFSLLFWRLNKICTIIVAVAIPISLNLAPIALYRAGADLAPLSHWLLAAPSHLVLFILPPAALFGLIDWLLLRRANIRPAK